MRRLTLPLLMLAALSVMLSACATSCQAGILLPQQVSYDASDLERALDAGPSTGAGAMSSSSRRASHEWPPSDRDQPSNPLELAKSLPTGNSSSSTSTSSAGGAVGSGVVLCAFNNTLTLRDDSPLGQLAEDRALSLPDPPGTDLLRPPRHDM